MDESQDNASNNTIDCTTVHCEGLSNIAENDWQIDSQNQQATTHLTIMTKKGEYFC